MIHPNHWLNFFLLTALLAGLHLIIFWTQGLDFEPFFVLIHVYFFAVSIVGSVFLFKNLSRVQGFMQKFFGFTTVKLLISFVFMATFIFNYGKTESINFILSFVVLYLIYTSFESAYFIKRFKNISSQLGTNPQ